MKFVNAVLRRTRQASTHERYEHALEELSGSRIATGADRDETIMLDN